MTDISLADDNRRDFDDGGPRPVYNGGSQGRRTKSPGASRTSRDYASRDSDGRTFEEPYGKPPGTDRDDGAYSGGYGQASSDPTGDDTRDLPPDYSLRGSGARTMRGAPPQRQYRAESPERVQTSQSYRPSRREDRRARRSDRRNSRQGIVRLLKDSM